MEDPGTGDAVNAPTAANLIETAKNKIGKLVKFYHLPVHENDPIWTKLQYNHGLTDDELSALKDIRCSPPGNIIRSL